MLQEKLVNLGLISVLLYVFLFCRVYMDQHTYRITKQRMLSHICAARAFAAFHVDEDLA